MAPQKRGNYVVNPKLTLTSILRPLNGMGFSLADLTDSYMDVQEWEKKPDEKILIDVFGPKLFDTQMPKYCGGKVSYRLEFADLREAAGKSEFSSTIPLSEREIRTVFLKNAEKFSNVAFDKAAEIVHAVVPSPFRGNSADDLQIRDEHGNWRSADDLIKGSSATLRESLSSGDEDDYPWLRKPKSKEELESLMQVLSKKQVNLARSSNNNNDDNNNNKPATSMHGLEQEEEEEDDEEMAQFAAEAVVAEETAALLGLEEAERLESEQEVPV